MFKIGWFVTSYFLSTKMQGHGKGLEHLFILEISLQIVMRLISMSDSDINSNCQIPRCLMGP